MELLEGSDTKVKFHITDKEYTDGVLTNETDTDLTQYDNITLSIKFFDGIKEFTGVVDTEGDGNSYVNFEILSEDTTGKCWEFKAEIWGTKNDNTQKNRLNSDTIEGQVLHSFNIPQWIVND